MCGLGPNVRELWVEHPCSGRPPEVPPDQVWSCVPEGSMKNWVLNCLEICFMFKSTFFFQWKSNKIKTYLGKLLLPATVRRPEE